MVVVIQSFRRNSGRKLSWISLICIFLNVRDYNKPHHCFLAGDDGNHNPKHPAGSQPGNTALKSADWYHLLLSTSVGAISIRTKDGWFLCFSAYIFSFHRLQQVWLQDFLFSQRQTDILLWELIAVWGKPVFPWCNVHTVLWTHYCFWPNRFEK